MSGHNKWSTIKRKKTILDKKRSKLFTDFSAEIANISNEIKTNPQNSYKLRSIIKNAKINNIPSINIEKAIQKHILSNPLSHSKTQSLIYEGYGIGGIGFVILVKDNNKNKISSELKHIFFKNTGRLTKPGSAIHLFKKKKDNNNPCYIPKYKIKITQESILTQNINILKSLKKLSYVENVFHNIDLI